MENFTVIGYQLPIIILFWISVFFAVLIIAALVGCMRGKEPYGFLIACIGFGSAALLILGITAFPFDGKYHKTYQVTGEVTAVSNVISDSGGDLTRTPVLTVEGIDRDITMSDPRAVNLKDKTVEFTCTVGWNYQAADTYSCKINQIQE